MFDLHPALSELVRIARQRKWLAYEELNNTLPDEMVHPQRLDELLVLIDNHDIEFIDEMEYRKRVARESRGRNNGAALPKPLRAMSVAGGERTSD
ncbi:MAG: RNA polymerase sigma factor region1.1 domain-containing protein, partial [Planctomycetes bacterium]|nr:RNA polymerase sigma factor region1.1 domain-containing protein [Planctomycetota bacterium]